jgi:hypothetical protein
MRHAHEPEAEHQMSSFDFVTGEDFRAALDADFRELQAAREVHAWKSVHVLAGSIVEAVLIDYLSNADGLKNPPSKPMELDLNGAITLCKSKGIISDRSATLSDVIRSYRNLIHPGRAIRLAESVDESSATVAVALVDMILRDVGKSRAEAQGFTAEQLVTKVERDSSAIPIIKHLLADMTESERKRLLVTVLPSRCLNPIRAGDADSIPSAMGALFRATYEAAPAELQKQATEDFVKALREEPETVVAVYETAFFRAEDLQHLAKAKQTLVKTHALARLKAKRSVALFEALKGVSPYLTSAELTQVVDAVISEIAYGQSTALDDAARALLADVFQRQSSNADAIMVKRLSDWVELLKNKNHQSKATVVELAAQYGLLSDLSDLDDLPF